MKNQRMTSYQFMMLMQELPNPMYYARNGANVGFRIKVGYMSKPINFEKYEFRTPYTPSNEPPMKMAEFIEVEFELVPNNNIWYWQPIIPIEIVKVDVSQHIKNWE